MTLRGASEGCSRNVSTPRALSLAGDPSRSRATDVCLSLEESFL